VLSLQKLLPYYLSVEPSPTDDRVAVAVVTQDSSEVFVSVLLNEREIFRFAHFGFVTLAWSPDGRGLAFAQDATLIVREVDGALRLCPFDNRIKWLAFDRHQRLWSLSGGRLEARRAQRVVTVIDDVDVAAVDVVVTYVRRGEICTHDGEHEVVLARVPEEALVSLSTSGTHVVAVLSGPMVEDRVDIRIVRFDLASGESVTLLDRRLAFGFNAGPGIAAVVLPGGEVLAAYEDVDCTRVWSLDRNRPITPDGFEVFEVAADATGMRLAVIASDTRTALGASERQLLLGRYIDGQWQFSPSIAGVYERPRWTHTATVEVLCGNAGKWTRRRCDPDAAPISRTSWCKAASGIDYDILSLPGPRHRRAAIVLLPRLHQQFVAGAQAYFFHHLLFSIATELAADGYDVVVLHGPGAIGRGRARREPGSSYMTQLGAAAQDLVRVLRDQGCESVGVLSGSMAAIAALRLAGLESPFSAFAFVAPLFEASIPVTAPLRHRLVNDPAVVSLEVAARELARPSLIVHGARDEVAPLSQVTLVAQHPLVELCLLEDEGHIFTRPASWQRTQAAIFTFFNSTLYGPLAQ
jgi:pimeloyl-ACP methyl ester carboxylesterase